ncbi:MAG TPA: hypothetical protein VHR55_07055 [Candidatus Limnocylindria bacterium]|nr:hypothetical protein [Candidatus Limnocylindria bacterium]
MPVVSRPASSRRATPASTVPAAIAALAVLLGAVVPTPLRVSAAEPTHLVISEVVTGGTSASDELVELYNPTSEALPLEGLELVYVSATGATVTRRVTWPAGAPEIPGRHHLLVANDAGAFAPIADALYSGGMAATGGSVALRIQGASTAVDAVGWGTAASTWMEGSPAPAPAAGESLERLPGGASGSTIDTDANAADFVVRVPPDPQNLGSSPVPAPGTPTPTPMPTLPPTPTDAPTPVPTGQPTPVPTSTPGVAIVDVATARAMPDGATVTVEGVSLTGSDFTDGGGYIADASGGIAILPSGGGFARGRLLRVSGEVDDRFGQRTLRVDAAGIVDLGPASEPGATDVGTGAVNEAVEGRLVRVAATITSPASALTTGTAFDIDDGSGTTRLVVVTATGIAVTGWGTGTTLTLVGVAGQRDSSGTGAAGYRVQPRDPTDIVAVGAPATPTPASSASASASSSPGASAPPAGVMTIATVRAAAKNAAVRVQGVVTLPTGIVDAQTAAIQDATGAILLRLSDEAGDLRLGERVDVVGVRSTKSGTETIRVTTPPTRLGAAAQPAAASLSTGTAGEAHEAVLVRVRGALVANARRAGSGTVSMEIDDGSGPLRVVAGAAIGLDRTPFGEGTWIEVTGVLGQETTGAQPTRGYRVWIRGSADIRVTAAATGGDGDPGGPSDGGGGPGGGGGGGGDGQPVGGLDEIGSGVPGGAVGATLVAGPWPEIGAGGVLWDGERLVALTTADADLVNGLLRAGRPPMSIELHGVVGAGVLAGLAVPVVTMSGGDASLVAGSRPPVPPATLRPRSGEPPRWVAVVGRLAGSPSAPRLQSGATTIALDVRCADEGRPPRGLVTVSGIALPATDALVVPCGGILAGSTLARATGQADAPGSAASSESTASAPGASERSMPIGIVAASLLGAAATILAGVAAWARRADPGPSPDDPEEREGVSEPDAVDPERAGPVLTLVPISRERAP